MFNMRYIEYVWVINCDKVFIFGGIQAAAPSYDMC